MRDTTMTSRLGSIVAGLLILWPAAGLLAGEKVDLKPSVLESEFQKVKYEFALANAVGAEQGLVMAAVGEFDENAEADSFKRKSPTRAMLLSLAVPGAGQFYYGSRIKPFVFLGAEIAAWALHIKWHSDGVDIQDQFEAYNREHWSRSAYEDQYLMYAYGVNDDDLASATEVSHHLPDVRTQQYYEMTGKYDQFSWGWDDAELNGLTLDDFGPDSPELAVTGPSTTPYSERRELYEEMRDDSNTKYDHARKMIVVSIVNRLISGVEAYISTRKHNEALGPSDDAFGRLDVSAQMRSYHQPNDTPFLNLAWKF